MYFGVTVDIRWALQFMKINSSLKYIHTNSRFNEKPKSYAHAQCQFDGVGRRAGKSNFAVTWIHIENVNDNLRQTRLHYISISVRCRCAMRQYPDSAICLALCAQFVTENTHRLCAHAFRALSKIIHFLPKIASASLRVACFFPSFVSASYEKD